MGYHLAVRFNQTVRHISGINAVQATSFTVLLGATKNIRQMSMEMISAFLIRYCILKTERQVTPSPRLARWSAYRGTARMSHGAADVTDTHCQGGHIFG